MSDHLEEEEPGTSEEKRGSAWAVRGGAFGVSAAVARHWQGIFEDALEPEVRALAGFAATLPIGVVDAVRLRDCLDEMVRKVVEAREPGRPAGRGLEKVRERKLAEREILSEGPPRRRKILATADFEALADEEIEKRLGGGTKASKVKQISAIYRAMRPGLPKLSAKTHT